LNLFVALEIVQQEGTEKEIRHGWQHNTGKGLKATGI
jgi:hypothetical protein